MDDDFAARHAAFVIEYTTAPCTREALDPLFEKHFPGGTPRTRYPDEWYADKDNRLAGRATGGLRLENGRMVWAPKRQPE